jgi:mRNA interferase HigB
VRVIAKSALRDFWERRGYRDAKEPLLCWYEEAVKAQWRHPSDIKSNYVHASFCANNRVVFNIAGNRYRLVVEVQYQAGIVWIKFVGTHEQYNRIDVEKVHAH